MNEQDSAELTAEQVEHYLQENPDFFSDHLHLLEKLKIPHPSGNAVSLISKQLEIFRGKHQELENQLNQLIDIARENDTSYDRMHKLTLAMLDAKSVEEAVLNLDIVLSEFFLIDFVTLRIIKNTEETDIQPKLCLNPDSEELKNFHRELACNDPTCGKPTLTQASILFGDSALQVVSYAIIPMLYTEFEGFLALGSKEEGRFHYSMGNLFLTQISELVGTRLARLMQGH